MSLIYTIQVLASPVSSQHAHTALQFARALIKKGHKIHRVFFYADGIHNANSSAAPPQDEQDIPSQWSDLSKQHNIELIVCIAAGIRRGILDNSEAQRYQKQGVTVAEPFELSGLGQLVESSIESDRLITFGP